MSDEVPVVTPINTGLAEKVRQKAEAEKAKLRALMPSSATNIVEAKATTQPQQLNEVPTGPSGIKRISTGLAEKTRQRIEEEKKKIASLMPSSINENTAVAPTGKDTPQPYSTDTKHEEWLGFGKARVTATESGSGDYCREPAELNWAPVTPNEIAFKYPKDRAITDLKMMLNAALQQPETAFGLIGKQGTSYLIKTDKAGQFYMTQPDTDLKNFTNPGLNTVACVHNVDGTLNDNPEDAEAAKAQTSPAYRRAAFGNNTLPGPKDNPPSLCYEDIEKEFGQLINFDVENKKALKQKTVNEGKQQRIKLSELNNLLFDVQKELKLHENKEMEKLANTLSNAIAESILSNAKSYDYANFCSLVNRFVAITEGEK